MHTDLITDADGQRTQVGPDPLDYVLRSDPVGVGMHAVTPVLFVVVKGMNTLKAQRKQGGDVGDTVGRVGRRARRD